jgi:organic hydroperoxide reductase OsmC/OhrA
LSTLHKYHIGLKWTGNTGRGTSDYKSYNRDHVITSPGMDEIQASSDPAFRGDPTKYNPEQLLLASVAACHMLWFLHLCSDHNVVVIDYQDQPEATMIEDAQIGGHFQEIILHPIVIVNGEKQEEIMEQLHELAHQKCFIANSLNFPVIIKSKVNSLNR